MKLVHKNLVKLLSTYINNKDINIDNNLDWIELINLSKKHRIQGFIYTAIKRNDELDIDKEILDNLKIRIFKKSIYQTNHIRIAKETIERFEYECIPVIILKGFIVRNFYQHPELRTMSDIDILVQKKDLDKVDKLLNKLGYKEKDRNEKHAIYHKKGEFPIEVHWTLSEQRFFKESNLFEDDIWKNAETINNKYKYILSLGIEDMIVYLILHMANHITSTGFGLRQLCDLVLVVNKNKEKINWNQVIEKCKYCRIYKFSIIIFKICNNLFDMSIPSQLLNDCNNLDINYLNRLIEQIIDNGVYGKKNKVDAYAKSLSYDRYSDNNNAFLFVKYIRFLFPPVYKISNKYKYVRKYRILAPIACIHRIFSKIREQKIDIIDIIKFVTSIKKTVKKQEELINWMEL